MKSIIFLIIGTFLCLYQIDAQIVNKNPLSPRITGYKIDVELITGTKTIEGVMEAFWVNPSQDNVPDIKLHMYLNAFRSNKTTFSKESGKSPGNKETDFGWINIKSITDIKGNDLKPGMKFISPDDNNPDDMTVLDVPLFQPARPGDTVFIKVSFVSKLPLLSSRTGFNNDFFFVGQWFPKFGVYEPAGMRNAVNGGWNCHQFHSNSEFYSNHSVYDVKITLPKEYVVGSGGMHLDEKEIDGERKTITVRAEDIVDFAWTAWPGYKVFTDQWEHVKLTLLLPEERTDQVARQFTSIKYALEYLTKNVGPYPWPHLTIVDPPKLGAGSGGMEYTTIFTSQSAYKIPEYLHLPEMVTIHEFGHAYFMGILASNEFEEPWLDEGVNSFLEERIMDHYWPDAGMFDHPLLKVADETVARTSYVASRNRQVISNAEYSWNYPHGTYGMMSYQKTATWLYTMMGIVGESTTNEIFREYYKKWAFKHPSGKDFVNVVNEVVKRIHGEKFGPDMNWFFDQTLYGTGICDYKVNRFTNVRSSDYSGMIEKSDSVIFRKSENFNDSLYYSTVQLERAGEIMLPVEVLIHFNNGDQILETWDGKARYKDFSYTGTRKVNWVKIDPEYKIKMDVNYINNSMTNEPDRRPVKRYINKFISFMQFFINFISL